MIPPKLWNPHRLLLRALGFKGFNSLTNHVQNTLEEEDEEDLMVNTSLWWVQ
jgi:hypothetical protein